MLLLSGQCRVLYKQSYGFELNLKLSAFSKTHKLNEKREKPYDYLLINIT